MYDEGLISGGHGLLQRFGTAAVFQGICTFSVGAFQVITSGKGIQHTPTCSLRIPDSSPGVKLVSVPSPSIGAFVRHDAPWFRSDGGAMPAVPNSVNLCSATCVYVGVDTIPKSGL